MPQFHPFSLSLLLAIGLATAAPAGEAVPQVIVLRNGNVLRGTVERSGERVRVISAGSEVHLRAAEVDLECESIETAYQQLRARLTPPTAVGHLQLAAWCVRQELWQAAHAELAAARQLEPHHPRLALLEQTAAHLQNVAPSQPKVITISGGAAAQHPDHSAPTETVSANLLAELPDGALEDFTRRVQPILVNNCTTSGCHRVDGPQQFQLNRDLLHGMSNRRSTMRNLSATLGHVNADVPLESELLARASAAHAGMDTPPLRVHQRDLHMRLEEWVLLVSGKEPPEATTPDATVAVDGKMQRESVVPAGATTVPQVDSEVDPVGIDFEAMLAPQLPQPPRVGVQLKAWTPRDEFDPEIFNRLQAEAAISETGKD